MSKMMSICVNLTVPIFLWTFSIVQVFIFLTCDIFLTSFWLFTWTTSAHNRAIFYHFQKINWINPTYHHHFWTRILVQEFCPPPSSQGKYFSMFTYSVNIFTKFTEYIQYKVKDIRLVILLWICYLSKSQRSHPPMQFPASFSDYIFTNIFNDQYSLSQNCEKVLTTSLVRRSMKSKFTQWA